MKFAFRLLKLILLGGVLCLVAQIIPAILSNEWLSWRFYFFGSIISGFLVSILLVGVGIYRLRRLNIDTSIMDIFKVSSSAVVKCNDIAVDDIVNRVESFLDKKVEVVSVNSLVIKSFSWFGWTTTILEFSNKENSMCSEIIISSKPTLFTTIFDFGESLIQVEKLKRVLSN